MSRNVLFKFFILIFPFQSWSQVLTTPMGNSQASFYIGSLTDQVTADAWVSPGNPIGPFNGAVNAAIQQVVNPARWKEYEDHTKNLTGKPYGSAFLINTGAHNGKKPYLIHAITNYSYRASPEQNEALLSSLSPDERKERSEAEKRIAEIEEKITAERERIKRETYGSVPETELTEEVQKNLNQLYLTRIDSITAPLKSEERKLAQRIEDLTNKNKVAFDAENVFNGIYQSLVEADKLGLKSVAVPTLGYDMAGILSQPDSVNLALAAYHSFKADHPDSSVTDFRISVYAADNPSSRRAVQKHFGQAFSSRSYLDAAKELLKTKPHSRIHSTSDNDFPGPRSTLKQKVMGAFRTCRLSLGF